MQGFTITPRYERNAGIGVVTIHIRAITAWRGIELVDELANTRTLMDSSLTPRPLRRLWILWLGGLLASAACELIDSDSCTTLYCDERGFEIDIANTNGDPLPRALYDVHVDADGYLLAGECDLRDGSYCDLTLTARGDDDDDDEGDDEQPLPPIAGRFYRLETTGRLRLELVENIEQHQFGSRGGPSIVDVDIRNDDGKLVDERFEPTYARTEPAGEGCGYCDHARLITTL